MTFRFPFPTAGSIFVHRRLLDELTSFRESAHHLLSEDIVGRVWVGCTNTRSNLMSGGKRSSRFQNLQFAHNFFHRPLIGNRAFYLFYFTFWLEEKKKKKKKKKKHKEAKGKLKEWRPRNITEMIQYKNQVNGGGKEPWNFDNKVQEMIQLRP